MDWRYHVTDTPLAYPVYAPSNRGMRVRWQRVIARPSVVSLRKGTRVDEAVVRDLTAIGVQYLDLHQCQGLSPAVVGEFSRLSALREIRFWRGDLTDEGLNRLWSSGPPALANVSIESSVIGDDGFRDVKASRQLRQLTLWKLPISNRTIAQLRELPKLEQLDLAVDGLTEDCTASLAAMPALRKVRFSEIHSDPTWRVKLKALNPAIIVEWMSFTE